MRSSPGDPLAVFVDSCVWIGALNRRDTHHDLYADALYRAKRGEWGEIVTSDYVLDEVVTRAMKSEKDVHLARNLGEAILESRAVNLLHVCEKDVREAWAILIRYQDKRLSFTDCTIHRLLEREGIEHLLTSDSDFDGLGGDYETVNPLR